MKVLLFATLANTVLGFAISNLILFNAEVDKTMNRVQYQRVVPIQKFRKNWKPTKTAQKQSTRRTLFRRHHNRK